MILTPANELLLLSCGSDPSLDRLNLAISSGAEVEYAGVLLLSLASSDRESDALDCAKKLLSLGVNSNVYDNDNKSALEIATLFNREKLVELFFKDSTYTSRNRALKIAIQNGYCNLIEFFVKNNVDPNNKDEFGRPFIVSISDHPYAGSAITTMLWAGADGESKDRANWNAMSVAAVTGNLNVLEVLINSGVCVNQTGPEKYSCVSIALGGLQKKYSYDILTNNHIRCAVKLLKFGAKKDIKDPAGETVLGRLWITSKCFEEIWFYDLLNCGLDINNNNKNQESLLHLSSMYGDEEEGLKLCKWAIKNKIKHNLNNDNYLPWELANKNKKYNLANFLLSDYDKNKLEIGIKSSLNEVMKAKRI